MSPPGACASTRNASHIGADMNHLWPVMQIAVAAGLGARGVGAHVGAALLLGHAHAERDARSSPATAGSSGRSRATAIFGISVFDQRRLGGERRDRRARHGDRAHVPVLDLRDHVEARGARDLGRRGAARRVRPARSRHAGRRAMLSRHEVVIGRMELDHVAAKALGVEGLAASAGSRWRAAPARTSRPSPSAGRRPRAPRPRPPRRSPPRPPAAAGRCA